MYTIPVEDILEVWKTRVRITAHIDTPVTNFNTIAISEQLVAQQKMLERLHLHLTAAKVS